MIKFAICDDEPFMVQEISRHLSQYMKERHLSSYQINCFFDGRSLLESGREFDLIFLDIQMGQPDGMETARILRQRGNHALFIFVTILQEYVFDAFEVQAYDYLVKPLEGFRFRRTMDRAMKTLKQQRTKSIVVQKGNSCEVVLLSQIVYCEVQGRKLYFHKQDGEVLDYYDKLKNFEQCVDERFFKCHRSYLVNLDYVRGSNAGRVILQQGNEIPVSRLREKELLQALLYRMRGRET